MAGRGAHERRLMLLAGSAVLARPLMGGIADAVLTFCRCCWGGTGV